MSDENVREASLEYHRQHPPGKISIAPTKQLTKGMAFGLKTLLALRYQLLQTQLVKGRSRSAMSFRFNPCR